MTAGFSEKFQRNVVPRWHDSRSPCFTVESRSLKTVTPVLRPDTSEMRAELLATQSVGVAVDALNAAIVAGDQDMARMAAEIVHKRGAQLPLPIIETARTVLDLGQPELPLIQPFLNVHHQRIAELRGLLQIYPRSPLLHLDLARHQLTLGQTKKAKLSVAAALTLGRHHRATLRAAARFFVCINQSDRAYRLIRDAEETRHDPWLLAAEISIGQIAGKSPTHWRIAKDFLGRAAVAPLHLSELATAAATIEMLDGNMKDAKKLFRQGLLAPTENALAQACWADGRTGTGLAAQFGHPVEGNQAFEAEYFKAYFKGDMQSAMECGQQWFYFEPFATNAITAAAHVAGLLDDYAAVEKFATMGLHGHHNSANLRNNLLYAKISGGALFEGDDDDVIESRIRKVVEELRSYIDTGGWNGVHAMANLGLLAFRIGQPNDGRTIYERTIEVAQRVGYPQQAATASIFFAREAILSGVPWANVALERARVLSKPFGASNTIAPAVPFYLRKIEALAKKPEDAPYILSAQSAKDFIVRRPPTKLRLERKSDGGFIVWVPPTVLR